MNRTSLEVGQSASFSKTVSESDVYLFAGISGDFNPVHVDEEHAKQGMFKKRIAHGILTASFISTVLGTKLPGPGAIYAKQDLKFLVPVFIGDTLTATCSVKEIIAEKKRVIMDCVVSNQDGVSVLTGEATLVVDANVFAWQKCETHYN